MSARLDGIVQATRAHLAERKRDQPLVEIERLAGLRSDRRDFRAALTEPGIALIAEHKRRSPSAGEIRPSASVAEIASAYEGGGAAALSILTERDHFDGSLEDLEAARSAAALPILRKDFTVDSYQLYEAVAFGADAVLLVVGTLDQRSLEALHADSRALELTAIVEVHDRPELERALAAGAEVIGINNRDLADFSVDIARTFELFERIPPATTVISESGISTPRQLADLAALGVEAVLVGEALMRADDPQSATRALLGGARPGVMQEAERLTP